MIDYAIDLGTTNSIVARWDSQTDSVRLLELPGISRGPDEESPVRNEHAIPSALYLGPAKRGLFLTRQDFLIGKAALEKETWSRTCPVVRNFKPRLMNNAHDIMARQPHRTWNARDCSFRFLKELCGHIAKKEGAWPRSLVFGVPVDSYEPYRAQLRHMAMSLGIRRFRLVDEPVAAAIGYGMSLDQSQQVLVFDFGGGTLDLALVRFDEKLARAGRCTVVAKAGVPLGGNTVDQWLLEHFCACTGFDFDSNLPGDGEVWKNLVRDEARRVKEALYAKGEDAFYLIPPAEFRDFDWQLHTGASEPEKALPLDRATLRSILESRGLYRMINDCLGELLRIAASRGTGIDDISQVLMVGGSSLLPGVFGLFEERFGKARVQAWQPFNAVAYGAAIFAADRMAQSDFITHDYALLTHDPKTFEPRYQILVPRNTPFPTAPDFWRHRLVPTCSTGLPEKVFKLLVCELGHRHHDYQEFWFDRHGNAQDLDTSSGPLVVPLNGDNPVMGLLNPPHEADNREARLDVSFMVNEEKWLCATVLDLQTRRVLMKDHAVVQLR